MRKLAFYSLFFGLFSLFTSCDTENVEESEPLYFTAPEDQSVTIEEYPLDSVLYQIEYETNSEKIAFRIENVSVSYSWYGDEYENILGITEDGKVYAKYPYLLSSEIFIGGITTTVEIYENINKKAKASVNLKINLTTSNPLKDNLSSSLGKYELATEGSWVEVTKSEYDNIYNAYYKAVKVGASDEHIQDVISNLSVVSAWSNGSTEGVTASFIKNHVSDHTHRGALIGVCYYNPTDDEQIGCNAKESGSMYTKYYQRGEKFPSHSGKGMHYFIYKKLGDFVPQGRKFFAFFGKKLALYPMPKIDLHCRYTSGDDGLLTESTFDDVIVQGFYTNYRQQ